MSGAFTTDRDPAKDWFVRLPPRRAEGKRILVFPHAGNGPAGFGPFSRAVADRAEVWALNLPGRQARAREVPRREFAPLVRELVDDLADSLLDRPYTVVGYCAGAALAYGVVREIGRRGLPGPDVLVPVAYPPPGRAGDVSMLGTLESDEFWRVLHDFGGVPEALSVARYRPLFEPALRADYALLADFHEDGPRRGGIPAVTAIMGTTDHVVEAAAVVRWADHAERFQLVTVEGGHWLLDHAPAELAEAVLATS
ncbi:thioesterase domain-containing protein [Streptomyces sp. NPDC006435]|uniref:thioesterase II family protein n=1 Tax=Streptomyces sp. NPDC006435 TaxID=3154300 RepID=UPI00339EA9D9